MCRNWDERLQLQDCSLEHFHLQGAKFWSWLPRIEKASNFMKYHRDKYPFTIQAWAACIVWPPSLGGKTWSTPESHLRVADGTSEVVIGWNPLHGTSKYNFISQIPTLFQPSILRSEILVPFTKVRAKTFEVVNSFITCPAEAVLLHDFIHGLKSLVFFGFLLG